MPSRPDLPRSTVCVALAVGITVMSLAGGSARAEEALVAVAANFAEVVEGLKPLFEEKTGHRLQATTGSTGKLYAQITAGAPFQALLSADAKTPEKLESEGAGVSGTRFTYAIGRLTLWSSDPTRIIGDGKAALMAADVRHVAIANPDLAPYGVAARETLQKLGLWEPLQGKIVMGQNIGQTYSMVATGNAQLGFVAPSALLSPRSPVKGGHWAVPQELFTPLRQDAVLLKAGNTSEAARSFLVYLKSPQARQLIEKFGYGSE